MKKYSEVKEILNFDKLKYFEEEHAYVTHYLQTVEDNAGEYYKNKAEEYLKEKGQSLINGQSIKIPFKFDDIPFPPPKNPDFTFIDLFAGIGGFRLALQNLNGKCVFSSEWDKFAKKTYEANFGEVPFGDITKIDEKAIPDHDILCGGFPCQPFSLAGVAARNSLGLEHGFNDPKQGELFYDIVRIVREKRPKVLFLENVKNLRSHDKGQTFKTIEKEIRSLGYSFYYKIINAQTEVPQKRERTYMVCFREQTVSFRFPEFVGEPKKLKSILDSNISDEFTISDKLWQGHQNRSIRNKARGTGFTVKLADIEGPSNTIVARYGKDGKECLIPQENKNPRKLTPRECARLQGFPDNYIIPQSKTTAYKQFGNSVAVPVIQSIAAKIIEKLSPT